MDEVRYYDIKEDIERYPDALFTVVWSGRGVGKTYSSLKYCIENAIPFLYLKRTVEDIKFIATRDKMGRDVSPFAPLNRKLGWDYHIELVKNAEGFGTVVGGSGEVVGYVLALAAVHKVKGFELSECDVIIFDEFIPQLSETRIRHTEGDSILELHATVMRDRLARGQREPDFWLFANATTPVAPFTETMMLTDDIVEMSQKKTEYRYLKDRYILLHNIPYNASMKHDSRLYAATRGTRWASMAFDNEFAFQDFSKVKRVSLKNAICLAEISYNRQRWYVYQNDRGIYYISRSRNRTPLAFYNMDIDGDRMRMWYELVRPIQTAVTFSEAYFESYSMYYLIMNYQKFV